GFAGAVFFPSLSGQEQIFLAFLFVGIASIGIPVYAASWKIFALYAGGILLPFVYVLTAFGDRLFRDIALLVPLFYAVCVTIAYRLNGVFDSGYRLRHAYGRLTEDYSSLNQRLEQQLVELSEARRQVEASGRKLALFAERAPIAVLELDPEGLIREVNHAAELLFGYAAAELMGGSVKRLVRPELHGGFDSNWRALMSSREPVAASRRLGPGLRVVGDAAGHPRGHHHLGHRAGPGRDAPARGRTHEEGVHLDAEPRAAHPAHLDHRLAAAHQFRGGRRGGEGRA